MCSDIYVWCQIARRLPTFEDIFALRNTCTFFRGSRDFCAMIATQAFAEDMSWRSAVQGSRVLYNAFVYVMQRAIVARSDDLFDRLINLCSQNQFEHNDNIICRDLAITYHNEKALQYFAPYIRYSVDTKIIARAIWNATDDNIWDIANFLRDVDTAKIVPSVIEERANFAQYCAEPSILGGVYTQIIRSYVRKNCVLDLADFRIILRECSRDVAIWLLHTLAQKLRDSGCMQFNQQAAQFIGFISSVLVVRDDAREILDSIHELPKMIDSAYLCTFIKEWAVRAARRGDARCRAYFDQFIHFAPNLNVIPIHMNRCATRDGHSEF